MSRQEFGALPGDAPLPDAGNPADVAVRTSMFAASKTAPDTAAKVQELSAKSGIPADVVSRNFDTVQSKTAVTDRPYEKIAAQTPKLNYWLQDPGNTSASHDDLDKLGLMEWMFSSASKVADALRDPDAIVSSAASGVSSGSGGFLTGLYALNDVASRQIMNGLWFMAHATGDNQTVSNALRWIEQTPLPVWADPAGALKYHGENLKKIGTSVSPTKERQTFMTKVIESISQMAPAIAASAVGGPAAGATVFAGQGADTGTQMTAGDKAPQEYKDLVTLGSAAVMGLGGEFGLNRIVDRAPLQIIKNKALLWIADLAVSGATQSGVVKAQTTANALLHHYLTNPDAPLMPTAGEEDMVAFATGAILRGVIGPSAPFAIRQHALEQETFFKAMGEGVKDSKLYKRLPDKMRDYIAHITKDGPIENVHIPFESWKTYWQEKGKDPVEALNAIVPDGQQKYQVAAESGADLVIPTADYATKIAPTEANAFFAKELRLSPEMMNAREAEEFNAAVEKELERLVGEAKAQTSAEQVGQDVVGQLVGGTGLDRSAIDLYGQLYEAVFGTLGARAGVDPHALYSLYGLRIGRPLPDILKKKGGAFDNLDAMLNALRTGDVPTLGDLYGKTLVEWLRAEGGVQDVGGDLASREPDEGLKPFERNLIQNEGLPYERKKQKAPGVKAPVVEQSGDDSVVVKKSRTEYEKRKGMPLDTAVRRAIEEGYLPEDADINALLDTIDNELRGQPVYSQHAIDNPKSEKADALFQLDNYLKEQGISLENLSNEDIKNILNVEGSIDQAGDGVTFHQESDKSKRGSFSIGENRQFNIQLLKSADLSTFAHESGHLFLEVFGDTVDALKAMDPATLTDTQRQMVADYDKTLKWLGVDSRGNIGVDQHEQWARGIEAYLREGKSPNVALRGMFARVRAWLMGIYKQLSQLNVTLTPEVTKVMDRLFATDEAILEAQRQAEIIPIFVDQAASGLSDNEWAAYQKTLQDATSAAQDRVQQKMLAEVQREHEDWWKSKREQIRNDIAQRVYQRRDYIALAMLQRGTLPDGTPAETPFKLDRDSLVDQFGKSILKSLPRPYVYSREGGVSPEAAAEMFGFNSGEELVHALINARPMKPLIEAETDVRMREQYGDMLLDGSLADEAKEAVMTIGRSEVIHEEMKALAAKVREVSPFVKAAVKDAAQQAKQEQAAANDTFSRFVPTVEAVRFIAENRIAGMKVKDIQPGVFFAAARRASKAATEAALNNDYAVALAQKQREMVNVEMYRAGLDAKEAIAKADKTFKKIFEPDSKLATKRNMDLVYVARALASRYMYKNRVEDVTIAMNNIKEYDPELHQALMEQLANAPDVNGTYKDLTYEQFVGMRDTVLNLWSQARREKQMMLGAELVEAEGLRDEMRQKLVQFKGGWEKFRREFGDKTWSEKALGVLAIGRRMESWAEAMDGGPTGPWHTYFWDPVKKHINIYRDAKVEYLQRHDTLLDGIRDRLTDTKIAAPEIDYTFKSREELLGFMLHTGNKEGRTSNYWKLLNGGRGPDSFWAMVRKDGTLDDSRVQAMIRRMQKDGTLTKADYDYLQGVWDLFNDLKPGLQAAHKDINGYYFKPVEITAFDTPFGHYKGGYVPAKADPILTEKAGIQELKSAIGEGGNNFTLPSAGSGATKSRVVVNRPLQLGLSFIPSHIDWALKYTHIEPRVRDVYRLLSEKSFRSEINDVDPQIFRKAILPWMRRAATQRIAEVGLHEGMFDSFWNHVRASSGMQVLSLSVNNALQNSVGLLIAATRVPKARLVTASVDMLTSPRAHFDKMLDLSAYMRHAESDRAGELTREFKQALINPTSYQKLSEAAVHYGRIFSQVTQGFVSAVAWHGAYEQAIIDGKSSSDAVAHADSVVRQTQSSFHPEDVAAYEAGTPFVRAMTMFGGWFNAVGNNQVTLLGNTLRSDRSAATMTARAASIYFLGWAAPAIVTQAIANTLSGRWKDDDDTDLVAARKLLFDSQLRAGAALVPGFGQLANEAYGAWFTSSKYDDDLKLSPAFSLVTNFINGDHNAGTVTGREISDTLKFLGMVGKVPLGALGNPARFIKDVADRKVYPQGPGDVARGLVTGSIPKR